MAASKLPVFISWAGEQAETLGKGFRDFLPDVVNMVEPFISASDIDKGTRWGDVLAGTLQESSCAIVCLTPESLKSIWVAFEAGAVSRAAGGPDKARARIWTYLYGLETSSLQLSPFAEYQATMPTEADTSRLIRSINQLCPDPVSAETLKRRFDGVFWPQYSQVIASAGKVGSPATAPPLAVERDLIPEILRSIRSVQQELRRLDGGAARGVTGPTGRSVSTLQTGLIEKIKDFGLQNIEIETLDNGTWRVRSGSNAIFFTRDLVDAFLNGSFNLREMGYATAKKLGADLPPSLILGLSEPNHMPPPDP